MSITKKVTAVLTALLCTLVAVVFCLLFTAPGNQLIAYSANNMVDGLKIDIKKGRFLYNDPFDVKFKNESIDFTAKQLKLDLYWWRCEGLCIENISAQTINVSLAASTEPLPKISEDVQLEQSNTIELPIDIYVKRIAVPTFTLKHPSADVTVNNFILAASAAQSTVVLNNLSVAKVKVILKSVEPTPSEPLVALAALPDIHFTSALNMVVERFDVSNVNIVQEQSSHDINNINGAFSIDGPRIELTSLSADYLQWQLASQLNATLTEKTPITATISLEHPAHHIALDVSGDLHSLALDIQTQGEYPLNAQLEADLKTENFPFSINASIQQWLLDVEHNTLKINDVQLSGKGNADDYAINLIAQSQLAAYPKVQIKSVLKGGLTHIKVDDLALLANDSKATMTASASWNDGIKGQFTGYLKNLKAQYLTDTLTSDVSGQLKGAFNIEQENWQLVMNDTQLTGTLNDMAFTFASDFDINNSLHARINKFELSSGENTLALSGDVTKRWNIKGKLHLNNTIPDKLPITGVGDGSLVIAGERLEPIVNLNIAMRDLNFSDIAIEQLVLKTDFNYAADWQTNASLKVENANVLGHKIQTLAINAAGDKTDHQLQLDLDALQGKAQFELAGKFINKEWQGNLKDVLLTDNVLRFRAKPAIAININTDNGDFLVKQHCWQSENSKLCIDELNQKNQQGKLSAKLVNFDLSQIKYLLPENVITQGDLNGHINANWQGRELSALTATINSHDLVTTLINEENRYRLPLETFTINAIADAQTAQFNARLNSSVIGNINADLQVTDLTDAQNMSGTLDIDKVLLTDLQPLIGTLEQLKGAISGQVAIAGTTNSPLLSGELDVTGVNLQGEQLPVSLVDSNVNIAFDKTTAVLKGKLKDGDGGSLDLTGDIDWQGEKPAVNLSVLGKQFYVRAQQGVLFKVSPDLKISLADDTFKLAGQVVVPYGRIKIEELPEGAVQVSDDEIIVDKQVEQADVVPFNYDINLKLIVENDVRIDSFGLESKIEGDLAISLNQQTPMIATGELNLRQGTYRSFGQDLIIRTGQIGFSGSIEKPYLNIKAIRNPENTANGVIAGVTLTGNVEHPSLKVFSEPAMDQAQSLAYLLNGQPLDEGNSSSDAMLAQLLLSQGVSRSEGVVSKVGESFGFSDVSLSSKGSGDNTKVEISGYLAPDIKVKYSVGIFDSLSEVAMRYQLMSQLYIEITSNINQNVDILYKFDWE